MLLAVFLLSTIGLTLSYSTSLASENLLVFHKQIFFAVLGWIFFLFFSFFDYHILIKKSRFLYIFSLALLFYVLILGTDIRGGKRWIDLGFFNFQPAEFLKIVIILGLAKLLYLGRGQINSIKNILRSFVYVLIPAVLVLLEPDFGSAAVSFGIWIMILLSSPIKKKYIAGVFIFLLVISSFTWQFMLKDFQKSRIRVFLEPNADIQGQGYNVRQAIVAVGSGGLIGKGLGKGTQSQNKFLPERQTDFIFAASAEQIGFFGITFLLGLFAFLKLRILEVVKKTSDFLGKYIALGAFFLILIHSVVNIGMNIGLLPVTGIPLPFLSAGGSFYIMLMCMLGIVQNIHLQSKILRF